VYDGGGITLTVAGQQFGISYTGVASSDASAMASKINQNSSYVTATASGNTTYITAKTTGTGSNYAMSCCTYGWNTQYFGGPNDTASASGSALTGGSNGGTTTIYDSGTCTITINSHGDSASWSGSGTTSSSIASALNSSINADGNAPASASLSGSTVNLTAKAAGSGTNYSLSSSCSYDSTDFSTPSFTTSNSGSALTGGTDASNPALLTTNYLYDVENRLVQKSFSNDPTNTPTVNYTHDQTTCLGGQSSCFNTHHRTTSTDSPGQEQWSHTVLPGQGSQTVESRTINGLTKTATYNYDLAGNLTSLTYPSGRVVNYAVDSAARLVSASDSSATYASVALYSPAGGSGPSCLHR